MIIKPPSMKDINAAPKPWRGMSFFAGCGGSSTGHKMAGVDILLSNEFVDSARESYEANHPTTKVLPHDIRRLDPKKLLAYCGLEKGELDLLDGSPPCFTEDTLIHTAQGMKFITDVNVGDLAMTSIGQYHRVYDTMVRPYTGMMHKIESLLGVNNATPEHPFYVRRPMGDMFSEPFWCEAKDVQEGDWIATPRTTPDLGSTSYLEFQATLTPMIEKWYSLPEFWWIIGHWCARGTLEVVQGVAVVQFDSRTSQENALLEQAFDVLQLSSLNSIEGSISVRKTLRIVMDTELVGFLRRFISQGNKSLSRRLPASIFHLAPELKQEFILGYVGRDYVSSMGVGLVLYSDSIRFLTEMRYLAASTFNRPLLDGSQFDDIYFGSPLIPRERTPESKQHKAYLLLQDEHHFFHDFGPEDPNLWVEVIENYAFQTTCDVYNFSVEVDETYVANNVVVHNCKGFSTAGVKEEGWGKEVKYSGDKYQQVDDLFDQYCRMIKGIMPKVFTAENVSGLVKGASKGYFIEIMKTFDELGYFVRAPLLNAAWLGVPQSRERIIFMGVRKDVAKALGYKTAQTAVPSVVPQETMAMLADALPNIMMYKSTEQDIIKYKPAINGPMPTITAADNIAYETARFSSAGFIEDSKGQRRKLTIDELKVVSGMPHDYVLTGKFEEQWERLGRVCVPAMTYAAASALIEHVLIPYAKKRKKKPGDIFR